MAMDHPAPSGAGSSRRAGSVDSHVGHRVRLRRLELSLSQEKLGELVGLTFQQVQKYEKGLNRVGAGRLFQLSRALDVRVDYFFEGLYDGPAERTAGSGPGFGEVAAPYTTVERGQPAQPHQGCATHIADEARLKDAFATISDPIVRASLIQFVETLAGSGRTGQASAFETDVGARRSPRA